MTQEIIIQAIISGLLMGFVYALIAAGLSGRGGGKMPGLADPLLIVPSDITSCIQEMHITLGHMLCGALEQEFGLI